MSFFFNSVSCVTGQRVLFWGVHKAEIDPRCHLSIATRALGWLLMHFLDHRLRFLALYLEDGSWEAKRWKHNLWKGKATEFNQNLPIVLHNILCYSINHLHHTTDLQVRRLCLDAVSSRQWLWSAMLSGGDLQLCRGYAFSYSFSIWQPS